MPQGRVPSVEVEKSIAIAKQAKLTDIFNNIKEKNSYMGNRTTPVYGGLFTYTVM